MKRFPLFIFIALAALAAPAGAGSPHDEPGSQGRPLSLHVAAWQGQTKAIEALLAAGTDVEAGNHAGDTLPDVARRTGRAAAIAALEVAVLSDSARRAEELRNAARTGDLAAMEELLAALRHELISALETQLADTTAHYRRTCQSPEGEDTGRAHEAPDARCEEALQAIELLQREIERLQQQAGTAAGQDPDGSEAPIAAQQDESGTSGEAGAGNMPAPRAIPVMPTDPESRAGRILYGIADRLEQWFGPESAEVRLILEAPMRAQERDGTVTVHLPGARLLPVFPDRDSLGNVSIDVTELAKDTYAFGTVLGRTTLAEKVLEIGEIAISGRWRADLGIPTRLNSLLSDIRLNKTAGDGALRNLGSLERLAVREDWTEVSGRQWRFASKVGLSGLSGRGVGFERLEAEVRTELSDAAPVLELHRAVLESWKVVPQAAEEAMAAILSSRFDTALDLRGLTVDSREWNDEMTAFALGELTWRVGFDGRNAPAGPGGAMSAILSSRFDTVVELRDVKMSGWGTDDVAFRLGGLLWRVDFDGRDTLAAISTRLEIAKPWVRLDGGDEMLYALLPDEITADVELDGFPLQEIVELAQTRMDPIEALAGSSGAAAGIRSLRVAGPTYEIRADGRFRVDLQSRLGVTGEARIRIAGLDSVIALTAEKGDPKFLAFLFAVKGLGKPVTDGRTDAQVLAYDAIVPSNGKVAVNGIPLDQF